LGVPKSFVCTNHIYMLGSVSVSGAARRMKLDWLQVRLQSTYNTAISNNVPKFKKSSYIVKPASLPEVANIPKFWAILTSSVMVPKQGEELEELHFPCRPAMGGKRFVLFLSLYVCPPKGALGYETAADCTASLVRCPSHWGPCRM